MQARPSVATARAEPGEHRLGLGTTGIPGLRPTRDGILYIPRIAASGATVPLLVLLHGGGMSAAYFRFMFPLADEFGVAMLALDSRGNTWDAIDSPFGPDVGFIDEALQHTFERVAIDRRAIALGGVSDGGMYALSLGLVNGDLFTHLIAVAPGFMVSPAPPVGRPEIFVAHGTRDNVYAASGSRNRIVPQLTAAGYHVTYYEFDGPHTITSAAARRIVQWLVSSR